MPKKNPDLLAREPEHVVMRREEVWTPMKDHPYQRDTVKRAAKRKRLHTYREEHRQVNVGVLLTTGEMYKMDGHTRCYIWEHGMSDFAPPDVDVTVHYYASMDALLEAYLLYDAPEAVDTASDMMFGAARREGLAFESDLLTSTKYSEGLRLAEMILHGASRVKEKDPNASYFRVNMWRAELLLFDACGPTHNRWRTPMVTGALLLLKRYGADAQSFLEGIQQDRGTRTDTERDALMAFREMVEDTRRRSAWWGFTARMQMVRAMVAAFIAYQDDRIYSLNQRFRALSDQQFRKWLDEIRADE